MVFSYTKFTSTSIIALWCYISSAAYTGEHLLFTEAKDFAFDSLLVYLSILIH